MQSVKLSSIWNYSRLLSLQTTSLNIIISLLAYSQPVFPLESKKRTYTYIPTKNSGLILELVANGHNTDNFGRFAPILRT